MGASTLRRSEIMDPDSKIVSRLKADVAQATLEPPVTLTFAP